MANAEQLHTELTTLQSDQRLQKQKLADVLRRQQVEFAALRHQIGTTENVERRNRIESTADAERRKLIQPGERNELSDSLNRLVAINEELKAFTEMEPEPGGAPPTPLAPAEQAGQPEAGQDVRQGERQDAQGDQPQAQRTGQPSHEASHEPAHGKAASSAKPSAPPASK